MISPIIIYPECFDSLEKGNPQQLEYRLWFSFFALCRLYGILLTSKEHEKRIEQNLDYFREAKDPLWVNYETLRKISPFVGDNISGEELNIRCIDNSVNNVIHLTNIVDFFNKDSHTLIENSSALLCTKKQDIQKIEKFLQPLLTFSLDLHIWDRYLYDWGNDPAKDLQFYTFTIQKILEWTEKYSLIVKRQQPVELRITSEKKGIRDYSKQFYENFEKVLQDKSKLVQIKIDLKLRKKDQAKDLQPLDRFMTGSIQPYNRSGFQDNILAAKIAHGFNFIKIEDRRRKGNQEYSYIIDGKTFDERYSFPNDFCLATDSFHAVSPVDFNKISRYI